MYKENIQSVVEVIENYFDGLFTGDIQKLKQVFDSRAWLYGNIKGTPYEKNLEEYLEGVKNRKSPESLGESFTMEILAVEVLDNVATAKVRIPMLGFNYYDFLSLACFNNRWLIVNKLFVHVE